MHIWIRGHYQLKTNNYFQIREKGKLSFLVPYNGNQFSINIDLKKDPNSKIIEVTSQCKVSDELYRWIQNFSPKFFGRDIIKFHEEFDDIIADFDDSVKKVISLIKYCLNEFTIEEQLVFRMDLEWSEDNNDYHLIPRAGEGRFGYLQRCFKIEAYEKAIQSYIDSDFRPFVALKYLHRAIRGDSTAFSIIDATIAAELAIKEFLIQREPKLELILMELPSPPIYKLYGPILKNCYEDETAYNNDFLLIKKS